MFVSPVVPLSMQKRGRGRNPKSRVRVHRLQGTGMKTDLCMTMLASARVSTVSIRCSSMTASKTAEADATGPLNADASLRGRAAVRSAMPSATTSAVLPGMPY